MPYYYFHLLSPDHAPVRDDEGMAFEDDAAARQEGMKSLGELLKEAGGSGAGPVRMSVQIERADVGVIDLLSGELSQGARSEAVATIPLPPAPMLV